MIAYTNNDGDLCIIIPVSGFSDADITKDVPAGCGYIFVDEIPEDRIFRNAWVINNGLIVEDVGKSKVIAHEIRRQKRSEELAPLDILATIPSEAEAAESARQLIRDKYAVMQNNIDSSSQIDELKTIVNSMVQP